jgi:hypothetical protein
MYRSTILSSLLVTAALVLSGATPILTLNPSAPVKISAPATAQARVEIAAEKPDKKSPRCPDKGDKFNDDKKDKDKDKDKDKGGDDHDCKDS